MGDHDLWDHLSFLVPPGEVSDWRRAVLVDAAVEVGVLAELPATPATVAERLGLDERAVRIVLEALSAWDVTAIGESGEMVLGTGAPGPDETAVLRHHARAIRGWSTGTADRLRRVPPTPGAPAARQVELMLAALAVNGRESAPGAIDACLARCPGAQRVLDVAGGHGVYAAEFAHRGVAATVLDRAEVLDWADRDGLLSGAGIATFAADLFEELPSATFDIVFCAGFTYTLDAVRNLELLARLRRVVADGGTLAIMTFLRGTDPMARLFAVQMMAAGGRGDTHGENDYRRWFAETGYHEAEVVRLDRRPEWLLLARPRS